MLLRTGPSPRRSGFGHAGRDGPRSGGRGSKKPSGNKPVEFERAMA